ncbi:hypothetical protein [Janthinobacterium sp. ZB1P44]|uniref:hypothetical protein n=1 Tax=Janthinobacterium sp. ZB1P44 TaxID=3424192 RepID=UPI003F29E8D1
MQLVTFGRLLDSRPDRLPGYRLALLAIDDAQVVATSGKTHHPIASRGAATDGVPGAVLAVSPRNYGRRTATRWPPTGASASPWRRACKPGPTWMRAMPLLERHGNR